MSALLLLVLLARTDAEPQGTGLRVVSGESVTIEQADATAAFPLHPEIAAATLQDGRITVIGRNAGFTQIIVVSGGRTTALAVTVEERAERRRTDRSPEAEDAASEGGTYDVRYLSAPHAIQATARTFRVHGRERTEMSFGGAWLPAAGGSSPFNVPVASYTRSTPEGELSLFDRQTAVSPLSVWNSTLRGLHLRRGGLIVTGGFNLLGTFEGLLVPKQREGVVGAGYELRLTGRQSLRPQIFYFAGGGDGATAGAVPSLLYSAQPAPGSQLLAEVSLTAAGPAGAADLLVRKGRNLFTGRVRLRPRAFPSFSTSASTGRTYDGAWSREGVPLRLSSTFSWHEYRGVSDYTSAYGSLSADYSRGRWTFGAAPGFSLFSGTGREPAIRRLTLPLSASAGLGTLQGSVGYEISHSGQEAIGHSVRGAVNGALRRLRVSLHGEHQTHAPTVGEILTAAPWLQHLLERLAIEAATPARIADLVRNTELLRGLGYATNVDVHISPSVRRWGWSSEYGNESGSRRIEVATVFTRQESTFARSAFATHSATFSQRLSASTDVFVTASAVCRRHAASPACHHVVAVSARQRLTRGVFAPLGRSTGELTGTVFRDEDGTGRYSPEMSGVSGIEVVLDGQHRTRTDEQGHFRFPRVASGPHRVEVNLPPEGGHYFTTPSPLVVPAPSAVHFGIGRTPARVFGIVRNDAGAPLPNITVRLAGASREWETRTEGDGGFVFDTLPGGVYDVQIDAGSVPAGYALDRIRGARVEAHPGAPAQVVLEAPALRSVSGRVRRYDRCVGRYVPVAGVEVVLKEQGLSTVSDEEGRYTFRALPAGPITLVAGPPDGTSGERLNLAPQPIIVRDLDLTLPAGPELSSDACGRPAGAPR